MKIKLALSIIFLGINLYLLPGKIRRFNLITSNNFITVTIDELPDCSKSYRNRFVKIRFENELYVVQTKCKYVKDFSAGQEVLMLHEPDSDIFLFKENDAGEELFLNSALIVLGVGLLIFTLLTKRK